MTIPVDSPRRFEVLIRVRSYDIIHERFRQHEIGDIIGFVATHEIIIPIDPALTTEERIEQDYARGLLNAEQYVEVVKAVGIVKELV